MSSPIRELIERRKLYYEVSPYYVVDVEKPVGVSSNRKKVQAGFDVDLYASGAEGPLQPTAGDQQFQTTLKDLEELAREILPLPADGSDIAIIPFENSLVLDTRHGLREEAAVRIRITHSRGLTNPKGPAEDQALSQIREGLRRLGVPEGDPG